MAAIPKANVKSKTALKTYILLVSLWF